MKDPIETFEGRIVAYDRTRKELLVRVPYDDEETLKKRQLKTCEVRIPDGRILTSKQRKSICCLIHAISDYSGEDYGTLKELLKQKFLHEDMADMELDTFSLSNCSMSLASAFQDFLVRFVLQYGVPCNESLVSVADDIPAYIYACLMNKKCCICGKPADLHHCEGSAVGMGRNRREIPHEGLEAMPLCRVHHAECHQIGQSAFNQKYYLPGGVRLDKRLCRLYNLN